MAVDIGVDRMQITNVTGMFSAEQAFTVPDNVVSMSLHALDGDIDMAANVGETTDATKIWTIKQGNREVIDSPNLSNTTMYFASSADTVDLQIRLIFGILGK